MTTVDRRLVMGGLAVVGALGGTFVMSEMAQANVYQTDVGEQKHVYLPDGSGVFLDTDTKLTASFDSTQRCVDLEYGQANFHIVPDAQRPFQVKAAGNSIVSSRSDLNVRCDSGKLSVVLLQGAASVRQPDARAQTLTLKSGSRVAVERTALAVDTPDLLPLLAWQTGQAIFREEELRDAVQEMNRYSKVKIDIDDPQIARFKVSGVYKVGDSSVFAHSLSRLLPVEATSSDGRIVLIADETRKKNYEEMISKGSSQ